MLLHRNSTVLITYESTTTQKTKGILELKLTKLSKTLESLQIPARGSPTQPLACPLAARIKVYRKICCVFFLPQKEERHSWGGVEAQINIRLWLPVPSRKCACAGQASGLALAAGTHALGVSTCWSVVHILGMDSSLQWHFFFFFLPLTSKIRSGLHKGISTEQWKSMHKALRINNNLVIKVTSVYPGLK